MHNEIDNLIKILAKIPGLGPRSARRACIHLLKKRDLLIKPLAQALIDVADKTKNCSLCGNIDTQDPCSICCDPKRDNSLLIIIEEISDLWALERSLRIHAKYHVLGGHLSPIDNITQDKLNLQNLRSRIKKEGYKEVVLALNSTIDGQTTAHYIKNILEGLDIKISQLAQGVPLGAELNYLDEGTLAAALSARTIF